MKRFDFIIISYNTKALTLQCIHSLLISNQELNSEINQYALDNLIVVDNNSKDGTINEIHKFKQENDDLFYLYNSIKEEKYPVNLIIIQNENNLGYAKACNIGIENSQNDLLIISNTDIIVFPNSIKGLFNTITNNNVAISGVQQLFPNFSWQRSYGLVPSLKLAFYNVFLLDKLSDKLKANKVNSLMSKVDFLKLNENALDFKRFIYNNNEALERLSSLNQNEILMVEGYIDGAFLGIDKSKFTTKDKTYEKSYFKYFDEDYFFYSEEMDLCFRANQVNKIGIKPNHFVIHYRGSSTDSPNNNYNPKEDEINYKSFDLLYNSKYLFCEKHLTKLSRKIYFFSEFIFFIYGVIGFGILKILTNSIVKYKGGKFARKLRIYFYLTKLNFNLFNK